MKLIFGIGKCPEDARMKDKYNILSDDLLSLEEILSGFDAYVFSEDVQAKMDAQGLSSVALGKRCLVSHTMIDRWRTGKAKPNGKERLKELGMALGMDAAKLDEFLLRNGYPRLYIKNPLDGAARLLLQNSAGAPDVVEMYRELTDRLGLFGVTTVEEEPPLATAFMSAELARAIENGTVSGWFERFRGQFAEGEKKQHTDLRLCRFLLLYLGDASIHELAVTGELNASLKNLLYPILAGKSVTVRYLREKLIAFGLYSNMTEDEIDIMLRCMKLQLLTEPVTALDMAVLGALRSAHERYPVYEQENLERVMGRLDPPQDSYDQQLLDQYRQRETVVRRMVEYYEKHPRTGEEQEFEKRYTSFSDHGVMDYVYDVLCCLIGRGSLSEGDAALLLGLIKRNENGSSTWN